MKNKLNKEYLLKLYQTYKKDNMVYALTMLKSLGLTEWFKNDNGYYTGKELAMLRSNIKFIDMFDLNKFDDFNIRVFILYVDNGISYFNQEQLDKLEKWQIKEIIGIKPELEKYLINCENYSKK